MKRLGIDARLYSQTGVGTYLQNLLYYLSLSKNLNVTPVLFALKQDIPLLQEQSTIKTIIPVTERWHTLSEQTSFLQKINKEGIDLMHFTYFSYPVLYSKKFIATVHDLTPLLLKTGKASTKNPVLYEVKHEVFKYVLSSQIKNAAHIITPTKTVKKQILNTYGSQLDSKITAIYEGIDFRLQKTKSVKSYAEADNSRPYFLYVGNFYPHKNIEKLIEAFSKVKDNVKLLLVGPDDFFYNTLYKKINSLHLSEKVQLIPNVSKQELMYLYTHAYAFIQPSLSEGFGLPIAEAAYFNVPIVASDIPVFQELLGDNYISFDPHSVVDIAAKINESIHSKRKFSYDAILQTLSFEKMAEEHLAIYNKFLS